MATTKAIGYGHGLLPHPEYQRPVPKDWQAVYLKKLRATGGYYLSAEAAGVSYDHFNDTRHADPEFAAQVKQAFELWADDLQVELRRGSTTKANPVPHIVLLKKARPAEYVERTMNFSLSATTQIEPEDGLELLKSLLSLATPATLAAIPADTAHATAQSAQVADVQGQNPVTLPAEKGDPTSG